MASSTENRLEEPRASSARGIQSKFRHAVLSVAFVLTYLLLSQPGVIFISRLGWSAWYPATGLVLALVVGVSPWYGLAVFLADALAGRVFYHAPLLSFGETIGSGCVALWYGGAAYILRGRLKIDLRLRRGRDIVRYIFVTMGAALFATLSGVLCLVGDHSIRPSEFWSSCADWFIGDGIGIVGLAPFLLIYVFPPVRRWLWPSTENDDPPQRVAVLEQTNEWHLIEGIGQAASLLAVLWIMFGPRWAHLELFYLSFIPILWVAMRAGIRLVAVGSLALNFGIVVAMHLFPPNEAMLAKVGLLMLVVSAAGLIVGATVTERQWLGTELHERTTYLNSLFENSPLGIVFLDRDRRVSLVNTAFTRLSLFDSKELVGKDLDAVLSSVSSGRNRASWSADSTSESTPFRVVQQRRKDGSTMDLEVLSVPLVIDGRVQGAYAICKDISEQLRASAAERKHAESLNRLVSELEVQTQQMIMLNEMAALLECCASTKEACAVVAQSVPKFFPEAIFGTLYTFKASRNLVEAAVSWGTFSAVEPVFAPHACWALRRGKPHQSQGGSGGIVCPHLEESPTARHFCLPMMGQGETLGVLHLGFSNAAISEDESAGQERLGITVAGQIALSLASLRLRETLRDQSIRDPLTGLFNRRFMQESLEREIIRAKRKNTVLSLLFMDIDHFKRFNDTFGHDAGDFVLQSIADLLRNFFRGVDVVCRCGGEEFAVILPESLSQHAAMRADQFREEVKAHKLKYRDARLGPLSISIGIAAFPEHCVTAEELLKLADQCLYKSKTNGRDQVTVANTEKLLTATAP